MDPAYDARLIAGRNLREAWDALVLESEIPRAEMFALVSQVEDLGVCNWVVAKSEMHIDIKTPDGPTRSTRFLSIEGCTEVADYLRQLMANCK